MNDTLLPIDRLIALNECYAASAVARWPGRRSNADLAAIAELALAWPDDTRELTDFLFAAAGWRIDERCEDIASVDGIDRTASMLGGFPWTCELYPWPQRGGRYFSPLVQLRLGDLGLDRIANFPDLLIQVWGNELTVELRTIEFATIADRIPDGNLRSWSQDHLLYERSEDAGIGEYILSGSRSFELPHIGNYLDGFTPSRNCSAAADLSYLDKLLKSLSHFADYEHEQAWERGCGHFGGSLESRQQAYFEYTSGGWRCLYQPLCREFIGLSIYFDGIMTILYQEENGQFIFDAVASR